MSKVILEKIKAPLTGLRWVHRDTLVPNDYNPNVVSKDNMELIVQSILTNGWTFPIVIRTDNTIIDGFHRWTLSGVEPLLSIMGGMIPVITVAHSDASEAIYGTVTHNRAKGTHQLGPMKAIVKRLVKSGKSTKEISKQLGMTQEEIFRLSDFSREEFLSLMSRSNQYSKAERIFKL